MSYICNICNRIFSRIYELERHKNRKIKCISKHIDHDTSSSQCEEEGQNINIISSHCEEKIAKMKDIKINELKCNNCNKIFTRADNLKRHNLKYCNIKNIQVAMQQMQDDYKETNKTIEELQNTIIDLKSKINNETINNINNNSNNNITNTNNGTVNINNNFVLKFGDNIDQSVLSIKKIIQIFREGIEDTIPNMVKAIHCNPNIPSYHNVYINNKNSNQATIYDGNQYKTVIADEAINELDSSMRIYISTKLRPDENYQICKKKLLEDITDTEKVYIEKKLKILDDIYDDTIKHKKSDKKVKYALYDGREIIKNTRQKLENKLKKQIKN